MDTRWLAGQQLNPDAEYRLFCLPYAGAGASIYRAWRDIAPPRIQVCALELPGRGVRMKEPPLMRLTSLVRILSHAIEPALDRPFAIFGHSMGGLIGFELARTLRSQGGPQPGHLFVSATPAPGTPPPRPLVHDAPDGVIKDRMRDLAGTPRELLEDDDLMALRMPTLRADFCIIETYEYREEPPLAIPITVFGGASDQTVSTSALGGWRRQSSVRSRQRIFPGDHFYLHGAEHDIVSDIAHSLYEPTTAKRS